MQWTSSQPGARSAEVVKVKTRMRGERDHAVEQYHINMPWLGNNVNMHASFAALGF
jgi:hypothetical protein